MNENFISTPRKGEKLLLKNSTYKHILKKDESPKKEAIYINETNFPNYDVRITEVAKLKKPQKIGQRVEIITGDVKRQLKNNAKKIDLFKLKVRHQISKNFKVSGKIHLPLKILYQRSL